MFFVEFRDDVLWVIEVVGRPTGSLPLVRQFGDEVGRAGRAEAVEGYLLVLIE